LPWSNLWGIFVHYKPFSNLTGMRISLILLFICGTLGSLSAQDLGAHRWKDRVLLLITGDLKAPEYIRQIHALSQEPQELEERRLVVYTLMENHYAEGLPPETWATGVPERFMSGNAETDLRVLLLGLDGGVKLDESSFVPPHTLWTLIDGMPMRKAALQKRDKY
jgi:hypothetical protein